jgi:hypothetical protein
VYTSFLDEPVSGGKREKVRWKNAKSILTKKQTKEKYISNQPSGTQNHIHENGQDQRRRKGAEEKDRHGSEPPRGLRGTKSNAKQK